MHVELTRVEPSGPFDFRWPQAVEHFEDGWEGIATGFGVRARFLHGIGERFVYARRRVHTVTFLDGEPFVEGVAADDYERSQALLSLIKPWKGHRLARDPYEVPEWAQEFELVNHRDEIDAPYSKRCLALKIRVDDLDRWVTHAVARRLVTGR